MTASHSTALAAVTKTRPPSPPRAKACEKLARLRPPGEPQYLREAFVHPANIAVITLPIALAVLSQSAWVLLPGLFIEVAFVALLAKIRPFRRRVDEAHQELERDAAAAARAEIFDGMSDRHRREYITLEHRVAHIRNRVTFRPDEDALGLRRLLAGYLKLALAHRQAHTALQLSDRGTLSTEIQRLEAQRPQASSKLRTLQDRRLALARQRAVLWDRNRENLATIEAQLSTIADVIHLIHDRSIAPLETETIERDIDQLLTDLEASEKALEELDDVSAGEGPDVESLAWLTAPRPT